MSSRKKTPYDSSTPPPKKKKKRGLLIGILVFLLIIIANLTGLYVGLEEDMEAEEAFPGIFEKDDSSMDEFGDQLPSIQGMGSRNWKELWKEKAKTESDHFQCRQECCEIGDGMYFEAAENGKLVETEHCVYLPGTCEEAYLYKIDGPHDKNPRDAMLTIVFAYVPSRDNIMLMSCWKNDTITRCPTGCDYRSSF